MRKRSEPEGMKVRAEKKGGAAFKNQHRARKEMMCTGFKMKDDNLEGGPEITESRR